MVLQRSDHFCSGALPFMEVSPGSASDGVCGVLTLVLASSEEAEKSCCVLSSDNGISALKPLHIWHLQIFPCLCVKTFWRLRAVNREFYFLVVTAESVFECNLRFQHRKPQWSFYREWVTQEACFTRVQHAWSNLTTRMTSSQLMTLRPPATHQNMRELADFFPFLPAEFVFSMQIHEGQNWSPGGIGVVGAFLLGSCRNVVEWTRWLRHSLKLEDSFAVVGATQCYSRFLCVKLRRTLSGEAGSVWVWMALAPPTLFAPSWSSFLFPD